MASSIKRKEEIECTLHREQGRAERRRRVGQVKVFAMLTSENVLSMQEEDTRKQITDNLYIFSYVSVCVLSVYVRVSVCIIDYGGRFFAAFC